MKTGDYISAVLDKQSIYTQWCALYTNKALRTFYALEEKVDKFPKKKSREWILIKKDLIREMKVNGFVLADASLIQLSA